MWIFSLLGGNKNLINNGYQDLARCTEHIFKVPQGIFNFYLDFFQHVVADKICDTNTDLKERWTRQTITSGSFSKPCQTYTMVFFLGWGETLNGRNSLTSYAQSYILNI